MLHGVLYANLDDEHADWIHELWLASFAALTDHVTQEWLAYSL